MRSIVDLVERINQIPTEQQIDQPWSRKMFVAPCQRSMLDDTGSVDGWFALCRAEILPGRTCRIGRGHLKTIGRVKPPFFKTDDGRCGDEYLRLSLDLIQWLGNEADINDPKVMAGEAIEWPMRGLNTALLPKNAALDLLDYFFERDSSARTLASIVQFVALVRRDGRSRIAQLTLDAVVRHEGGAGAQPYPSPECGFIQTDEDFRESLENAWLHASGSLPALSFDVRWTIDRDPTDPDHNFREIGGPSASASFALGFRLLAAQLQRRSRAPVAG